MITNKSIGSYGRWGNMVFQIAAVIGIARRSRQDFGFPPIINHDHRDRFGSTEDVDIDKYLLNELPRADGREFTERHCMWGFNDVYLPSGDWDIRGHFQSQKYFTHCIDEVRHYLTFKEEPGSQDYVACHFRAGDYENGGKAAYHPRMDIEYYVQAMSHFGIKSKFLVFTDDVPLAVLMFQQISEKYGYDIEMANPQFNYIQSFAIMKNCHSFICANSSFSLAAAILANQPGKKIVAPRLWFGDPAGGLQMDYPENCIII